MFAPSPLPFETNALEPFISERTMNFHYGKHYKNYLAKLNELTLQPQGPAGSLEETMMRSHKYNRQIFQNAAQVWNHEFFWKSLSPKKQEPSKKLSAILKGQFNSIEQFKADFETAASGLFGSGWVWVVQNIYGQIEIKSLEKAENPLTEGLTPLLVCDVWEHAYYLDFQNDRSRYVRQFWEIVNWDFFEHNIQPLHLPLTELTNDEKPLRSL